MYKRVLGEVMGRGLDKEFGRCYFTLNEGMPIW